MPENFDFNYDASMYDAVKDHHKFFIILNQAMADGSFPDLSNKDTGIHIPLLNFPVQPYDESFSQYQMNLFKMNNIMYMAVQEMIQTYLHNQYYANSMFLTKLNGGRRPHAWWPNPSIVYLPQINHMLIYRDDNFQESWLASHEYVVVIPLHPYIPTQDNHS